MGKIRRDWRTRAGAKSLPYYSPNQLIDRRSGVHLYEDWVGGQVSLCRVRCTIFLTTQDLLHRSPNALSLGSWSTLPAQSTENIQTVAGKTVVSRLM